jgi:Tfp pilus assembly protein PilE
MGELDRLDDLDLSLLAEIKRSDKGAVEVKLVDRMAVMERLLELTNSQADTASAFLQAIAAVGQEE